MARRRGCFICGKEPEDDDLAPLATRIMVTNAAGYGAFFDPGEVPAWMHAIAQMPEQGIELCASCAAEHLTASVELVEGIAAKEEAKGRLVPKQAEKLRGRAQRDEKTRVTARAKRLGLSK